MMSDKDNDDGIEDVITAAEEVLGLVRRNKDVIGSIIGGAGSSVNELGMSDGEPLKKMYKTDEKIEVVVEVPEDSLDSIGFTPRDEGVDIEAGEKVYRAMTPSDVKFEEAEVTFNNGVLTVMIPRTGDTEVGVDTEVVSKEISIEDDEENEEEDNEEGEE